MLETLKDLLQRETTCSESAIQRVLDFYQFVLRENELQNLTRLTSASDFFYGHVVDVLELLKCQKLSYPVLDLGSGVGVPGLLSALLEPGEWVLCDSEKRKAEYLQKGVDTLGLDNQKVRVFAGRAEEYLRDYPVPLIIARAVGPVERIYSWIRTISTWNSLLLFKGPGWNDEWEAFKKSKYRKELSIVAEHSYEVKTPTETKTRKLIQLTRVPRGTK